MYLLDTDVLSNIVKRQPSALLIRRLKTVPSELQFTSAVNVGEIYYGAGRSNRKKEILKAFETHVFPNIAVLPFDETSGRIFGKIKAELEKSGIGYSEPDLRIASIAIQHDFTLITGNTRHFIPIHGLQVENWLVATT
jgi:tRNA(fMet)-specific endonuclease VapC